MADIQNKVKSKKRKNRDKRNHSSQNREVHEIGIRQDLDEGKRSDEVVQQNFERELVWCIQQLELGLSTSKIKRESKQEQDAVKALRILQNEKAPLIRKRQVMRNTFGDYRKKMEEEGRKYATNAKKMCLKSVDVSKQNRSTFLRKSSQLVEKKEPCTQVPPNPKGSDLITVNNQLSAEVGQTRVEFADDFEYKPSGNDFKFNFGASKGIDNPSKLGNLEFHTSTEAKEDVCGTSTNFYKMQTSENSFRFSFPTPES